MNKNRRMQDLEFLIRQRFIIKKYTPDELYGFFNVAGLDYFISEVCEAYSEVNRTTLDGMTIKELLEKNQ